MLYLQTLLALRGFGSHVNCKVQTGNAQKPNDASIHPFSCMCSVKCRYFLVNYFKTLPLWDSAASLDASRSPVIKEMFTMSS